MKSSKPNTNNRQVSANRVMNKDIKTMPIKPSVLPQPAAILKAVQRPATFKPRQSRASQGGGR